MAAPAYPRRGHSDARTHAQQHQNERPRKAGAAMRKVHTHAHAHAHAHSHRERKLERCFGLQREKERGERCLCYDAEPHSGTLAPLVRGTAERERQRERRETLTVDEDAAEGGDHGSVGRVGRNQHVTRNHARIHE